MCLGYSTKHNLQCICLLPGYSGTRSRHLPEGPATVPRGLMMTPEGN
jgi:hypothetical protein